MAWLAGWDKRIKITIDHDDIDAALVNFPILIYLSGASGIGDIDKRRKYYALIEQDAIFCGQ